MRTHAPTKLNMDLPASWSVILLAFSNSDSAIASRINASSVSCCETIMMTSYYCVKNVNLIVQFITRLRLGNQDVLSLQRLTILFYRFLDLRLNRRRRKGLLASCGRVVWRKRHLRYIFMFLVISKTEKFAENLEIKSNNNELTIMSYGFKK